MGKQLQHTPTTPGGPCGRCGLKYSPQTAYVPCFEEGDTMTTWKRRVKLELLRDSLPAIVDALESEDECENPGAHGTDGGPDL